MGRAGVGMCPDAGRKDYRGNGPARSGVGAAATRLALAALAACLLLGLTASGASAVVRHLSAGRKVSYQPIHTVLAQPLFASPAAKKQKPLLYHGGPIMPANTNYAFYWAPPGSPPYAAHYQEGIDLYFERLAHDSGGRQNVDSVATQYGDAAGEHANYNSTFGGVLIDTNPYPPNGCTAAPTCLTDEQLQAEPESYVKAHKLPTDLTHEYFILTPPGIESCFEAASLSCSAGSSSGAYCAYHSDITVNTGVIIYADDPYTYQVEGCDTGEHPSENPAEGTIQGGLSHEHNESITDPEISAWTDAEGWENGDKCRTFEPASEFGTPLGNATDGAPYNQVVDGGLYYYQQEFSNETLSCQQRLTPAAPTVKKVSPKNGPAAGGTTITLTGAGFEAGAGVRFGAQAAREVKFVSPTTLEAVSPEAAPGKVPVTVSTAYGTSEASRKSSFTFKKAKK